MQTRVAPSSPTRASSISAWTPETGRLSTGTLTVYVYSVPASTGHPGVISAHASAISSVSIGNDPRDVYAVTLGETEPDEKAATNVAATSTWSPIAIWHSSFGAQRFDTIVSGRLPSGPV